MRAIGYTRVSTEEQGDSRAGLEAQEAAIRAEVKHRGWELKEMMSDVASGGSLRKRDELGRALRMLAEARPEHESLTAACRHVGGLLGVSPETLRVWQRRYDIDTGVRPGVTSDMAEENRRLRRENAELKKANEVLKAASVFFAKELDRPRTK